MHTADLHIATKVPRPVHGDNDEPKWLQQFGDDRLEVFALKQQHCVMLQLTPTAAEHCNVSLYVDSTCA